MSTWVSSKWSWKSLVWYISNRHRPTAYIQPSKRSSRQMFIRLAARETGLQNSSPNSKTEKVGDAIRAEFTFSNNRKDRSFDAADSNVRRLYFYFWNILGKVREVDVWLGSMAVLCYSSLFIIILLVCQIQIQILLNIVASQTAKNQQHRQRK